MASSPNRQPGTVARRPIRGTDQSKPEWASDPDVAAASRIVLMFGAAVHLTEQWEQWQQAAIGASDRATRERATRVAARLATDIETLSTHLVSEEHQLALDASERHFASERSRLKGLKGGTPSNEKRAEPDPKVSAYRRERRQQLPQTTEETRGTIDRILKPFVKHFPDRPPANAEAVHAFTMWAAQEAQRQVDQMFAGTRWQRTPTEQGRVPDAVAGFRQQFGDATRASVSSRSDLGRYGAAARESARLATVSQAVHDWGQATTGLHNVKDASVRRAPSPSLGRGESGTGGTVPFRVQTNSRVPAFGRAVTGWWKH